jgi:hypothetical protein
MQGKKLREEAFPKVYAINMKFTLAMIVGAGPSLRRAIGFCGTAAAQEASHVQSQSHGRYRTFCIDTATAVLHAVADRFLVNIQTDVVPSLHGGASLVVSESAWSLSSAFLHQALLHDLFIQTIHPEHETEA